jgi:hypothetical protein
LRLRSEQANLALIDVEALALLEGAGPRPMLIEGGKAALNSLNRYVGNIIQCGAYYVELMNIISGRPSNDWHISVSFIG